MNYLLRGAAGQGLGDLASASIPQPVYENCSPLDAPCVMRNQAKGDAWEAARVAADNAQHLQWCLTQSGYDPAGCYATYGPGGTIAATANAGQPVQGFVPQPNLTPAQIQQTYNPGYVAPSGVTVDSPGGSVFLPTGDKTGTVTKSAPPAGGSSPAGTLLTTNQQPALDNSGSVASTGFDLSALPWYVWAGAAAAAFFAFGGSGRGR